MIINGGIIRLINMKMISILGFLLLINYSIISQVKIIDKEMVQAVNKNLELKQNRIVFDFLYKKSEVAELIIDQNGEIVFLYNSSGYYIKLSDLSVNNDSFTLSFIKVWVGAEETKQGDTRTLLKYIVKVHKDDVKDKDLWLIRISDVTPVLIIDDSYDSVKNFKRFNTKYQTEIKKEADNKSPITQVIESSDLFDIIDVVPDKSDEEKFWVKIKVGEIQGFIPLDALSDNWTVKTNNLKSVNIKISTGTINDTRVRLRTESNLTSETIAYLDAGEKVKVIDRSEKKQKIDDMEAYWLQVETEDKQTGWVYGWFVDVE